VLPLRLIVAGGITGGVNQPLKQNPGFRQTLARAADEN
jgi:hypothetical protein